MRVSVVVTVLNEEGSIKGLLDSLINQTRKPDEIIIVDAGSTDGTQRIISKYKARNSKQTIKLIIAQNASRSKGRNIGIKASKNEIIALTDAGCKPRRNWLEELIKPFSDPNVGIVAGFYTMTGDSAFQRSAKVFLGTFPNKFDENFLPSARSMALRKRAWKKVGGFPERLKNTAEDTLFNYLALKKDIKFARVKNARVEWRIPDNFFSFCKKVFSYARGDAKTKIIWNPNQKFSSHNIKAVLVFLRYLVGSTLLFFSFRSPLALLVLIVSVFFYALWAYRKAGLWGIVLQVSCDISVMLGFLSGIIY